MKLPIGTRVKWTAPGGGIRDYDGEIVAFVEMGESLSAKAQEHERCGWASPDNVELARKPRYLIRTEQGLRTAPASLIERQNRDA